MRGLLGAAVAAPTLLTAQSPAADKAGVTAADPAVRVAVSGNANCFPIENFCFFKIAPDGGGGILKPGRTVFTADTDSSYKECKMPAN